MPETAAPSPTALPPMAPASPTPPALSPLEGRYQLLAYQVNGIPQSAGGALAIARLANGHYQWQAQLLVQGMGGLQTFAYNGQLLNRSGQWFLRISASNDPNWEDIGEVPAELAFDGRNAAFRYVYDSDLVQSAWGRSQ
jgi:hypothetical protein